MGLGWQRDGKEDRHKHTHRKAGVRWAGLSDGEAAFQRSSVLRCIWTGRQDYYYTELKGRWGYYTQIIKNADLANLDRGISLHGHKPPGGESYSGLPPCTPSTFVLGPKKGFVNTLNCSSHDAEALVVDMPVPKLTAHIYSRLSQLPTI